MLAKVVQVLALATAAAGTDVEFGISQQFETGGQRQARIATDLILRSLDEGCLAKCRYAPDNAAIDQRRGMCSPLRH